MTDQYDTKREEELQRLRDRGDDPSDAEYEICLHCKNPFHVSEGVVTSDAALCDTCNGR